jgi:hypothetical protein
VCCVGTGRMIEAVTNGLNIYNAGMLKSSIKGISKGQHASVHVAMQFLRVDRAG